MRDGEQTGVRVYVEQTALHVGSDSDDDDDDDVCREWLASVFR